MSDLSTATMHGSGGSAALVRDLQSRLKDAFNVAEHEHGGHDFDTLRAGLASGRFGGLPLSGPAVDSLLVVLERLGWVCSPGRLARVVPHFPTHFDIETVREVAVRLGFASKEIVASPGDLKAADCPAILAGDPDHPKVVDFHDGRLGIVNAQGRMTGDAIPRGKQAIVVFRRADAQTEENPNQRWLASRIRRLSGPILLLFGLTGFINLMVLVTSFTVMAIYDTVIPTKRVDTLIAILLGLGIAVAIELAFRRLKARMIGDLCGRLDYMVGTTIFAKLLSLPTEMISSVPIGTQISRLSQFETVRDLFAGPFAAIVLELPFVVVFILILFAVGGPLGMIAVVLVVAYIVLGLLFLPPLRRRTEAASRLRQERQALMLETAANIRTIRAAGCEDVWSKRLHDSIVAASEAHRRQQAMNRLLVSLSGAGVPAAGAATAVLGAMLAMNGDLSVGVLVAAMIIIWRVLAPIQQAFLTLTRMADMSATVRQIDQMMRIPGEATADDSPVRRRFAGRITIDRLSFRYPSTSQPALAGLSAEIKAGEFVAVMGASGAGKTTLLRVILDLYRPNSGIVCIDGVNARQIPNVELRASIGYVPHSVSLFHGSIAQNLRLAAPEAEIEDLRRIASELGVLQAIESLPRGFDTPIDHESREALPTGFRQVLAIAQAMLRDPQILLLDEPAQALDPVIEEHFIDALKKRQGRITTLMVTHRPSHARNADRILLLDHGQLKTFDTPDAIFGSPPVPGGANG